MGLSVKQASSTKDKELTRIIAHVLLADSPLRSGVFKLLTSYNHTLQCATLCLAFSRDQASCLVRSRPCVSRPLNGNGGCSVKMSLLEVVFGSISIRVSLSTVYIRIPGSSHAQAWALERLFVHTWRPPLNYPFSIKLVFKGNHVKKKAAVVSAPARQTKFSPCPGEEFCRCQSVLQKHPELQRIDGVDGHVGSPASRLSVSGRLRLLLASFARHTYIHTYIHTYTAHVCICTDKDSPQLCMYVCIRLHMCVLQLCI